MDQRLAQQDRGVVEKELRLEGVAPVNHQVVLRKESGDVRGADVLLAGVELDSRIDQAQPAGAQGGADCDFFPARSGAGEQQIREIRTGDQQHGRDRAQQH